MASLFKNSKDYHYLVQTVVVAHEEIHICVMPSRPVRTEVRKKILGESEVSVNFLTKAVDSLRLPSTHSILIS